ncbi:DUF2267 domain-containing protein [Siculibacillus lacustris]|uniref:DUF2267 domain-containing protein n=1 Tax=Siculibacillus lacustris TaxID=1549641 RepID=A0A4Q9VXL7_9HYPH|nr:DUF2267 domain-containing protein [Siculibacillus lacustris]TBW41232.1 DUF2267 domain-containing protein [Siculibacillus lacustris]
MTLPRDYVRAFQDFEQFLGDLKDSTLLATHNVAYAETRAVLHVFRRRLTAEQGLAFATVLPPLLRALFVEDWPIGAPVARFGDPDDLAAEVAAEREPHNVAPSSAIADVAATLRRHVDRVALDQVLAALPDGARAYWRA